MTNCGFTTIELLFAIGVLAVLSGVALPNLSHALARYRTQGAARAVLANLQRARALAVAQGANVAIRFTTAENGVQFSTFVDGNRNGISTAEIADGTDPMLDPPRGLDGFGDAGFGLWPGIASPDGSPFPDASPIRVGSSNLVTFSSAGSATPGSVYVRGPGGLQYVVRIYGDTGKTQILRYAQRQRTWVAP